MAKTTATGGTKDNPWKLKTPSGQAEYSAYRDEALEPALVVNVGKTELRYHLRCITDLHAMLKVRGDWMPLGIADEQKPAAEGTVEAWARPASNRRPLVWTKEGTSRAVRDVCAAAAERTRTRRGRAESPQQPDAGSVGRNT